MNLPNIISTKVYAITVTMFKNIIKPIAIVYLGLSAYALLFSNLYIFHPPKPATYNSKLPNLFQIPTNKSSNKYISAVYLSNPKAKYTIIYSHGNAEDLGVSYHFLQALQQHGFSVLSYDYSGYGLSSGKPNEKNTYQDITAVYNYATKKLKIPAKHIINMGHSLGAGVAVNLSANQPTAGLIITGAFVSAFRVMTRYPILFGDKYSNINKIKKINTPLLIIHGTKDNIIPFWHGKKLYKTANQPKEFIEINGAGHNNLIQINSAAYWEAITKFSQKI